MKNDSPVRFGILGVGRIAANAFAPALAAAANAELAAAASRELSRAEALAPRRAYGRYEDLLDDPNVEAVYIGAHNGLHRPLTLAALERGKHVLCEKPLGCDAQECAEMAAAARTHGRHLAEAFMYRHHPAIGEARRLVASGEIGGLRTVEGIFSFRLDKLDDVRLNRAWGGGGLLDVGCYCVNACRYFFEGMPLRATALGMFHPEHDVDMALHGVLEFPEHRFGVVSCGFDGGRRSRIVVCGTHGTLTLPGGFGVSNRPVSIVIERGDERRVLDFEPVDVYRLQIEDFARAVRGGAPLLAADDGWRNAVVMDALLASARAGGAPQDIEN